MTVVCTFKQQAKNVFTFLTETFAAHLHKRAPPTPVYPPTTRERVRIF
jgi:hypothetical protein